MATNDEIIIEAAKHDWSGVEYKNDKATDYENYIMDQARANTARQIFAELDEMIEELDDSLRTIGEIVLDEEKYEALKKKYGIE